MGQLEWANVPVKEWIIDPDVLGHLGVPSDGVCLPAHYGEIVHTNAMPRGVTMVIDGGPEVFLEPFPKSSCRPLYVFLITIHLTTLLPVDYPTCLSNIIPALWGHLQVLDGIASFEMDLDPCLTTFIKFSLCSLVYGATM